MQKPYKNLCSISIFYKQHLKVLEKGKPEDVPVGVKGVKVSSKTSSFFQDQSIRSLTANDGVINWIGFSNLFIII